MSTKRQDQPASSSNNRRRQREDSSSSPSHQQPHHVMTQPVFLQKIFPYAVTPVTTTCVHFNAVSTSWSETIQHYSGAFICWQVHLNTREVSKITSAFPAWLKLYYLVVASGEKLSTDDEYLCALCVWVIPSLLETLRLMPDFAKTHLRHLCDNNHFNLLDGLYENRLLTLEICKILFRTIEEFSGIDSLRTALARTEINLVCGNKNQSIVAHHFDTLERVGFSDWKSLFFNPSQDRQSRIFLLSLVRAYSIQTVRTIIDKCRSVGEDFLDMILGLSLTMRTYSLKTGVDKFYWKGIMVSPLRYVTHRETLAAEVTRTIIKAINSVDDEQRTLLKKNLGIDEENIDQNALLFACLSNKCTPELLDVLFGAIEDCVGKEGLARQLQILGKFREGAKLSPKCALAICATQGSPACVQTIIDKCRELGGDRTVKEQLELNAENGVFLHSFSPSINIDMIQSFVTAMRNVGLEFLKERLLQVREPSSGRSIFLKMCSTSGKNVALILKVFKDNNFTDEEILTHFQFRDKEGMSAMMIAASSNKYSSLAIDLLLDEISRIQFNNNINKMSPSPNLVKQLLNARCSTRGFTPLIYAIASDAPLETVEQLLDLYRSSLIRNDGGVVSEDELKEHLGSVHPPAPRVLQRRASSAFHVACASNSSAEVFDYLLGIYENIDDNNTASLKNVLLKPGSGTLALLVGNDRMEHEAKKKCLQKLTMYLVKFGFFADQYQKLSSDGRKELDLFGIDNRLPLQSELARERNAHGETKQVLNGTKRKLADALRKLEALSSTKK